MGCFLAEKLKNVLVVKSWGISRGGTITHMFCLGWCLLQLDLPCASCFHDTGGGVTPQVLGRQLPNGGLMDTTPGHTAWNSWRINCLL